tara:strand:+ start:75 stop:1457 length:1383 start_codon:yes stop_codon:yes gene_type:complete
MRYIYFLILLCSLFISCNKSDLSFPPDNQILSEDAIQDADDLQQLLNSAYDVLANTYNGNCQNLKTLLADNIAAPLNNYDYMEIYNRNTLYFNGTIGEYYKQPYIAIYRCNYLIENIDLVESLTTGVANRLIAEAKFIRALCHYDLVNLFAHPFGYTLDNSHDGIIIKNSTDPSPLPRNTVKEVYDFILSDLQYASDNLPTSNGNYASKYSVDALLAHVNFQMNNLDDALSNCNSIINSGQFILDNDSLFLDRYRSSSNLEMIFGTISTSNFDIRSSGFTNNYRSDVNDNPTLRSSSLIYDMINEFGIDLDRRSAWFELKNIGLENEFVAIKKFNKDYFNVPIFHLTQIYLLRAEILTRLGNLSQATEDINKIISRAYINASQIVNSSLNNQELLDIIKRERQLELCFEGYRLNILKQRGAFYQQDLEIRNALWSCDGFLLQFPATSQTNLFIQNPPGGC